MGSAPRSDPAGVPKGATERVVARIRRHGRILILPSLLLIVVAGATSYLVATLDEAWQRIAVLAAGGVLVLVGTALPLLAWLGTRTTITTTRVILRSGVFVRTRRDLPHRAGYAVSVRRSLGQRMAGSGDVRIDAGHDRPVIVLRDVPSPEVVASALHELTEDAVRAGMPFATRPFAGGGDTGDTVAWGSR
ncbi:PH domain-containing protein [Agromyces sp. MMS24-JH15]|uniref:PH domain-containing protein n=1 Tax=Agromyces sp. MMS24-JH15 TaxID=3243765 RepID=UPI00374894FD